MRNLLEKILMWHSTGFHGAPFELKREKSLYQKYLQLKNNIFARNNNRERKHWKIEKGKEKAANVGKL